MKKERKNIDVKKWMGILVPGGVVIFIGYRVTAETFAEIGGWRVAWNILPQWGRMLMTMLVVIFSITICFTLLLNLLNAIDTFIKKEKNECREGKNEIKI